MKSCYLRRKAPHKAAGCKSEISEANVHCSGIDESLLSSQSCLGCSEKQRCNQGKGTIIISVRRYMCAAGTYQGELSF